MSPVNPAVENVVLTRIFLVTIQVAEEREISGFTIR
jgi:hypothetical protein